MNSLLKLQQLKEAETKAALLFNQIEERNLIKPGITEKILNDNVYQLALELFGIRKYWHKRIVRAGRNTLLPYQHNPPNLVLQEDDILFLDFGPVFEDWEADYGRTYVIGNNPLKQQLKRDIENAWKEGQQYYLNHKNTLTGASFYEYTCNLALKYGWEYGNQHCGHLIGNFPHEKIQGEEVINYLHPNNLELLCAPDHLNQQRFWIYEIHFIDKKNEIGGFMEGLLLYS